ncbi:MAG TPA: 2-methylcitrate dehydratase [Deltaproteobacteria bacterium]|nr:MAG: 2-methylcitrate dehydratase [Deltaproteobacteria bacterium GWA2_65_63]OGP26692.1 MAG: 2-methylcitrate dehydratase [Deltaproteobacteria bacterium GWB2_65_81]OGP77690.1 MAG: 2-methylcitrate dehydratase [Deltaproteobacteria bacterium RBG_16_66_15]HAM34274.1 2-methylcitrate dehydratase [Deltaproteobacteria bacterium]HBG72043.1 2-methylcitrate dehydratase [Deltaproteobacteria bacterium]
MARQGSGLAFRDEGEHQTLSERLGRFSELARWEDLSSGARQELKIRTLDSLGCAFGALTSMPARMLRQEIDAFGGTPLCTLFGGGKTSPDRAAFYNGALVRYLDFNDSYLAKGETCHPSDNLGAVLAAAEYRGATGKEFLTALALSYQVHCRLSDAAPVRQRGFDHTTQGAFAVAAGCGKALGLDASHIAHALGISGASNIALRVTRTGALSHWKGLAYPNTAFNGLRAAFLAMRGITGPLEVFEGTKGWMQAVSGAFDLDWSLEDLERVLRTIVKKYNAEIHSQSAIEGLLELMKEEGFLGEEIDRIRVDIFDVAHLIIGGGAEGDKTSVQTKEDADHSLPYILAVAALDGKVMPAQYAEARIGRDDVQSLLRRVTVVPDPEYTERFPGEHACRITVTLKNGMEMRKEKRDYEGFHTRPVGWERAEEKFHALSREALPPGRRDAIVKAVKQLEHLTVREFTSLLC